MGEAPVITTVNPDDPALCVKVGAKPPIANPGGRYEHRRPWTLDLLERSIFEFRAAGAWDGSKIELNYSDGVLCEVLASRGEDAMPWGWRPSQGPPPTPEPQPEPAKTRLMDRQLVDVVPAFLGNRVLHGLLLIVILVAVLL